MVVKRQTTANDSAITTSCIPKILSEISNGSVGMPWSMFNNTVLKSLNILSLPWIQVFNYEWSKLIVYIIWCISI